jgi:DNA-binding transcriptional LysR family regulator
MDLRRLRYFVAVAEELHFGRAAERVHVVQSAISQQIKLLEEEFGFPLFERSSNRVTLTVPGEVFLPEARDILRRAGVALQRARASAEGTVGRLGIGFVDNVLWSVLPPILRDFRAARPEIELSLRPMARNEQLEALRGGAIDIGIMPSPPPGLGVETALLVGAPLLVAVPEQHALAGHASISLLQLADEPWVVFPLAMRSRILEIVAGSCADAGFAPRIAQEAEQLHTLLALVSAGLGVTLVPDWVANAHPPGVCFAAIEESTPRYELLIGWNAEAANPAIRAFRDIADAGARTPTLSIVREDHAGDVVRFG